MPEPAPDYSAGLLPRRCRVATALLLCCHCVAGGSSRL